MSFAKSFECKRTCDAIVLYYTIQRYAITGISDFLACPHFIDRSSYTAVKMVLDRRCWQDVGSAEDVNIVVLVPSEVNAV